MDINDYQLISKIGKGGFAQVYKVKNIKTNKEYAAKVMLEEIDETKIEDSKENRNLKRELTIMLSINHPAVLKFKGYSPIDLEGNKKPTIITDYMPNGSLEDILQLERRSNAHEYWNDTRKLINIYGIASAMLYLHSHDIIHRDLKPENILMDKYLFPKVADFGLSKSINQTYVSTTSLQGTPAYIAPEIWSHSSYSPASDVYSFSLIVYEIMTNDRPFDKCSLYEVLSKLSRHQRPEFKSPVSEAYKNLIQMCWAEDPEERPTFEEIVNMLQDDRGFITDCVDESDFLHYVDIISKYKDTFGDCDAEFHIDDHIQRDTSTFTQVSIKQFFNQDRKMKIIENEPTQNSNHKSDQFELKNSISVNDDDNNTEIKKFGFDEFLEFMKKGLDFKKNPNFPKQMRFLFDGMDTDGSNYLDKSQIIDCISKWKAGNFKWISKMIFLGADKDKSGKVPISELKDVCDNLGRSFDHEDFEYSCMLEFGKMKKKLKYWEFYVILSGEWLSGIESDPYEGKLQKSKDCFIF